VDWNPQISNLAAGDIAAVNDFIGKYKDRIDAD
jgi:hypothetical protein